MNEGSPEVILVTNSIYPYHLHNVAILSLPFGATYHFRYERRYFHLDSFQIERLPGKIGILVLRDFERATFVPLRTFRVLAVDDCGEFVFLDLEFLHFVEYAASHSELEAGSTRASHKLLQEREKYSSIVDTQIALIGRVNNSTNEHLPKLIFSAAPYELARITTQAASEGKLFADAWSHVVTALAGIVVYQRVCFYLLGAALELNSSRYARRFRKRWRAGLVLETGKMYLIQVYQLIGDRTAPPKPGFKMRLQCMEGHLSPLRSEVAIDGAYDRLSFVVSVLPQEREKNESELALICDQPISDPTRCSPLSQLPPSAVQLQLQWPLWDRIMKRLGYPLLFVLGGALFLMADRIQTRLALGDTGKYLVQLIGLSLLALGGKNWGFLTGAFKSGPPGTRAQ